MSLVKKLIAIIISLTAIMAIAVYSALISGPQNPWVERYRPLVAGTQIQASAIVGDL